MDDADDRTGNRRPYARRLAIGVAILVPVLVLTGGAAWFVRSYVMPPSVAIAGPDADTGPSSATAVPQAAAPAVETTGRTAASGDAPAAPGLAERSPWPAQPAANWPAPPASRPASVWDSVPLPGPPRPVESMALAPTETAQGAADSAEVPLPRARTAAQPRAATVAVPLPRPRPAF